MEAKGTFSVNLSPSESDVAFTAPAQFGQLTIDKTFEGDLQGTSVGQMISCRFGETPSAGYVAIEQVTGTLAGKTGSFVFQHFGVMSASSQRLVLEVLPDSGTGELTGLSGELSIDIVDGQHYYVFQYDLPTS